MSQASLPNRPLAYQRNSGAWLSATIADDDDAHRRDEIGVPAGKKNRADDRQRKYQQKHRILQRADVLPDEPDQDHADHVQQRQRAVAPPAVRRRRGGEEA